MDLVVRYSKRPEADFASWHRRRINEAIEGGRQCRSIIDEVQFRRWTIRDAHEGGTGRLDIQFVQDGEELALPPGVVAFEDLSKWPS
mgnify:CR=1 FL=1